MKNSSAESTGSGWLAQLRQRAPGLILIAALVACWEVSWRLGIYRSVSLPKASDVARALGEEVWSGEIPRQLAITLVRVMLGLVAATVVGVALGTLMGVSRFCYHLLAPLVELLRPIPVSALVPVAILFFGIETEMKVVLISYAAIWPILINTVTGIGEVEPELLDTGRTFRMGGLSQVLKVQLIDAGPYIMAGVRISLAVSLVVCVVAEMIAGGDGIGSYLLLTQRVYRVDDMYAGIVVLGVIGYVMNSIFLRLERAVFFWKNLGD